MKKQIFLATATVLALAFTSCKKYEASAPLNISSLPTVTIEGKLLAELDETQNGFETVPAGVKVMVSVAMDEYNPNNSTNDYHNITAMTDANGNFSIKVPVTASGVDAYLSFGKFKHNKKYVEIDGEELIVETQYELNSLTLYDLGSDAYEESIELDDLIYSELTTNPNANTFVPETTVMYGGTLTYRAERRNGVLGDTIINLPVPAGTTLLVEIEAQDKFGREYFEVKTIKTTAGGKYEIEVPVDKYGETRIWIFSEEILQFEDVIDNERFLFEYTLNINSTKVYFVDSPNNDYLYTQGALIQQID